MEAAGLNLIVFITAILTVTASTRDSNGVCNSCNCQFNNIQVLDQLVDGRIANTIGEFLFYNSIVASYVLATSCVLYFAMTHCSIFYTQV